MSVKSIQFAATRINGAGAEVVSLDSKERTNFSVYTRDENGFASWDSDYNSNGYGYAMARAAELSMEHFAPIEQIK